MSFPLPAEEKGFRSLLCHYTMACRCYAGGACNGVLHELKYFYIVFYIIFYQCCMFAWEGGGGGGGGWDGNSLYAEDSVHSKELP